MPVKRSTVKDVEINTVKAPVAATQTQAVKINTQSLVTLILAILVAISFFQTYQLTRLAQGQGITKTQTPAQAQPQQPGGVQNLPSQQGGC